MAAENRNPDSEFLARTFPKTGAVIAFALCIAYASVALAQSGLPTEVQVDLLQRQIVEAYDQKDSQRVLKLLADLRGISESIPPPLSFIEATQAWATKDYKRAHSSLNDFLKTSPRNGPRYEEALSLYPKYETAAREQEERLAAERELEKQARLDALRATVPAMVAEIEAQMLSIPAGSFRMGSKHASDEKPVHDVQIKAFRLGKYEVTFEQYDLFAELTGRPLPSDSGWGRGNRPVINVSWDYAQAFIGWLNHTAGRRYRLPSEAEWEYAARAGATTDYPWGEQYDPSKANGASSNRQTTAAGSYPANAFGAHDMIGNVWEWVQDCYHVSYKGAPADGSAWTSDCPSSGGRVVRGGSWFNYPASLRVSDRAWYDTAERDNDLGFRLAQDP